MSEDYFEARGNFLNLRFNKVRDYIQGRRKLF